MPGNHAFLPASSSERWLNCPPSAKLNAEADDKESSYAAEGTLAHAICEVKLRGYISAIPKRSTTAKLKKLKNDPMYQPEMDGYTEEYLDYIKKIATSFDGPPTIRAEEQVDYSRFAPEGFGTSDCLILFGDELHVIDFKYGKGILVSPENNSQLKLYALGAINKFGLIYSFRKVVLHIVQPRLGNIDEWGISTADLLAWGLSIQPIAQQAFNGEGEFLAENDLGKQALHYYGVNQKTGKWGVIATYGGKLTENIVQAVARDCLAVTLERLDAAGLQVVMHIHDEAVIDCEQDKVSVDAACDLMGTPIPWAPGLPLKAAGFESSYYMKD